MVWSQFSIIEILGVNFDNNWDKISEDTIKKHIWNRERLSVRGKKSS